MFLYEQPELLTKADHDGLGLTAVARPFEFAKAIRAVPIVAAEIASAQKHYPVVFSNLENPALVAVVGIYDDVNLYVGEDGEWLSGAYIPSYLRCHPFTLAAGPNEKFAVVIDRAAAAVSESPQLPFFDGNELSSEVQARVDFCNQFNVHRLQTKNFCSKLMELGLLSEQHATTKTGEGVQERLIASYVAIDAEKVQQLDTDTLRELHQNGSLSAIFAQVFSLENWYQLLSRYARSHEQLRPS